MAVIDNLSALIRAEIRSTLSRSQGVGGGDFSGLDRYDHLVAQALTNGNGAKQGIGAFTAEFTVPFTGGGIVISLASTDPLGASGDDVPSSDPEGLKLRAIEIENLDDPVTGNYFELSSGVAGVTNWILPIAGAATVRIPAGGVFLQTFPNGIDPLNDGVDDEIVLEANVADVDARLTYLFG